MSCDRCGNEPCTCKYQPCLLKYCAYPGCSVMVRWRVGELQGDSWCKWHRADTAYYEGTPSSAPEPELGGERKHITLEEFGYDLYDCIRCFSARHQLRRTITRLRQKDSPLTGAEQQGIQRAQELADELTTQIMALLPKLQPDDVRRLLAAYDS